MPFNIFLDNIELLLRNKPKLRIGYIYINILRIKFNFLQMEQCCSSLAGLQADVPDSSSVNFTAEEPLELLAQAEMHQTGLEQEQQTLASLEHRLEHALSLSSSQVPISPGPVGKTLVKIQENVRRWGLFNTHVDSTHCQRYTCFYHMAILIDV